MPQQWQAMAAKAFLRMLEVCSFQLRSLSIVTPRYFTEFAFGMVVPFSSTLIA